MELLVFLGVGLGIADHALDLVVRQAGAGLDDDAIFLAGRLILGRDVQDAVSVDIEGHLDLRHTARRRRDVLQVELTERLVGLRHFALALQHMHGHCGLIVVSGREGLLGLGRNRGVLLDQLGHHTAQGLDAQAQRRHVEQQHILDLTAEHTALNGRTDRDRLIGIHILTRLLAEEFTHLLLHLGHTGLATDQQHVIDLTDAQPGILERYPARRNGLLDQILDQRFQLGAGQLQIQVLRSAGIGSDVRQIDFTLLAGGQLDLGLFRRFLEPLQCQRIAGQVDAALLLELLDQVVDDALVEVLTAQEGVTIGREHLELLLAIDLGDLDDRDVKGAAAQVINRDLAVLGAGLVHAKGQRCRSRLVDDALDFQTGDAPGILGGLTLAVVEIGRHGDHRFGDRMAEIILGGLLHLHQHARRNFRRRHFLVARLHPGIAVVVLDDLIGDEIDVLLHFRLVETAPNQTLDREQGVLRIGNRLALGWLADGNLAILHEGDNRRCGAVAFAVLNHPGLATLHDRYAGIGGAQVDTDNLIAHDRALFGIPGMRVINLTYPGMWGRRRLFSMAGDARGFMSPLAWARPGRRAPWRDESAAR